MTSIFDVKQEKEFLNSLVSDYKDVSPYSEIKKDIIINYIDSVLKDDKNKRGLQMGCSNGYETEQLAKRFDQLDVVDGAEAFVEKLKAEEKYQNVNFIFSLFEEFEVDEVNKYDYVFCNYVLEHVYDSAKILSQISRLLKRGGTLFVVVPNGLALSRRIALSMGMLNELEALTENDKVHGHRKVYTLEKISSELENSGFKIQTIKGIVFKILADFQLNKLLKENFFTTTHIMALQQLANEPGNLNFSDSFFIISKWN